MPRTYSSGSEEDYVLMPVRSHAGSEYRGRRRPTRVVEHQPEELVINNHLVVPGGSRLRAASTGERPTTIINVAASERGHSRSRSRGRHYDSRSSSSDYYTGRSRSRHRPHSKVYEEDLAYSLRKELDLARDRRGEDRARRDREEERRRWQMEEEERRIKKQKERDAILLEARLEEEKKKKEQEELRKRILREEEEKIRKEKEKKKAEDEEFERKVKEKFMNAGMMRPFYYDRYW